MFKPWYTIEGLSFVGCQEVSLQGICVGCSCGGVRADESAIAVEVPCVTVEAVGAVEAVERVTGVTGVAEISSLPRTRLRRGNPGVRPWVVAKAALAPMPTVRKQESSFIVNR